MTDATEVVTEAVETDAGPARITWHRAKQPRLVLAVSHGAGGGIEARDLKALAAALPAHGVSVALGAGVPTLVVQGGNDPFGRPHEFPEAPGGTYDLIEVPYGDHGFAVPKRAEISQERALELITDGVAQWAGSLG